MSPEEELLRQIRQYLERGGGKVPINVVGYLQRAVDELDRLLAEAAELPLRSDLIQSVEHWKARASALAQRVERLEAALTKSLELQAHYAELLNMNDGGKRMVFKSVHEWLTRLEFLASSTPTGPQTGEPNG